MRRIILSALVKVGLRHAVHGIRAPFVCGGTFVPKNLVTICFPDKTRIPVLRAKGTYEQTQLLQPLIGRCSAAPFGRGRKTKYDRAVRDALQIKAEGGAFSVLNFDPAEAGILESTDQHPEGYLIEFVNNKGETLAELSVTDPQQIIQLNFKLRAA